MRPLLFGCPSNSWWCGFGGPATPVFLDARQAQEQMDQACEASDLESEQLGHFQLICTSLDKMVDIVVEGREAEVCGDKFMFVPPARSVAFAAQARERAAKARRLKESGATGFIFPGA